MDQIYFWILILLFIILILDYTDKYFKNKENFSNNKMPSAYYIESRNLKGLIYILFLNLFVLTLRLHLNYGYLRMQC